MPNVSPNGAVQFMQCVENSKITSNLLCTVNLPSLQATVGTCVLFKSCSRSYMEGYHYSTVVSDQCSWTGPTGRRFPPNFWPIWTSHSQVIAYFSLFSNMRDTLTAVLIKVVAAKLKIALHAPIFGLRAFLEAILSPNLTLKPSYLMKGLLYSL
jgi:hypothetical protein